MITAAGNLGRDAAGAIQYGGITAPGNAPWVLTVGASNDKGTVDRADDTIAAFSSRGPGLIDGSIKPDLVAPGVGIESLGDTTSFLYQSRPSARRWGAGRSATGTIHDIERDEHGGANRRRDGCSHAPREPDSVA